MKGKILLFLFALPFFGVGVWMAWTIGNTVLEASAMNNWVPVEARLSAAGYETHRGDESDTYAAFARYAYVYNGQHFENDRVAIASGADNIGSYQQDTGNRLAQAMGRGEAIRVYVDPEQPSDSIIDREIRWGLLGFNALFLLVFGGAGLGLIIYVLVSRKPGRNDSTSYGNQPWLANDSWQSATIRSNSRLAMFTAWGFATFWNLVSAPLPFLLYAEITEKKNYLALIGLLFPLVGLFLLKWALTRTLEWRRFGPAPVTLDPFPGSIGGHVGGVIDLRTPYAAENHFSLSLTSIRSYVSGSGKNRSRRENAKWQENQVGYAEPGGSGTRVSFRFEVPDGLAESDATQDGDDYYLWRLNLSAELPGTDLERSYEIPVYATREESRALSGFSMERARAVQHGLDDEAVRRLVNLSRGVTGSAMHYPMGRNFGAGLMGALFGAMFAGIGWILMASEDELFMGSVFGIIGLVIAVSSLYFIFNSLEVVQDGLHLETIRRLAGIPVRRRSMRRQDFVRLEKNSSLQTQSGGRHLMHYSVHAIANNGQRLTIGEGFRGSNEADAAMRLIASEFGLKARSVSRESAAAADGVNFLAADS